MQDASIEREAFISRNERHAHWQSVAPSERDRINAEHLASWQPPTPSQREASRVALLSLPPVPPMASFQRPEQWLQAMFAGCPPQSAAHPKVQHSQPRKARSAKQAKVAKTPRAKQAKVAKTSDPGPAAPGTGNSGSR